jgi:hypothetical protein
MTEPPSKKWLAMTYGLCVYLVVFSGLGLLHFEVVLGWVLGLGAGVATGVVIKFWQSGPVTQEPSQ